MIASIRNSERSVGVDIAIKQAQDAVKQLGVSVSFKEIGRELKTTYCELFDDGRVVSTGLGKGVGHQSQASAMFEALEHYYFKVGGKSDLEMVDYEFGRAADTLSRFASPDFERILSGRKIRLASAKFYNLSLPHEEIFIPYFLCDPYYEPEDQAERGILSEYSLKRYATNSGTSSGVCTTDAILHGLLEVIERDALGVELLRAVIRKPPYPVRQFDLTFLPADIRRLCGTVETETNGGLTIWNITSDVCVPVVLAALSVGGKSGSRYFGSGAAISFKDAIERAALEALQYFHAHELNGAARPLSGANLPHGLPNYLKCFIQKGFFEYIGGQETISSVDELFFGDLVLTPTDQISHITSLLSARGMSAYCRSIFEKSIAVTQVVVPQLERFHLVGRGVPVAPGRRGRMILDVS